MKEDYFWNVDYKIESKDIRDKVRNVGEGLIMQNLWVLLKMMVFMLMERERY